MQHELQEELQRQANTLLEGPWPESGFTEADLLRSHVRALLEDHQTARAEQLLLSQLGPGNSAVYLALLDFYAVLNQMDDWQLHCRHTNRAALFRGARQAERVWLGESAEEQAV